MLLGIIFFIVGIVVFFEPGGTYLALSVLFGIVVILSGAFELYLGTKAPTGSGKGWYIAGGVVEILLGILLLCTPSMLFTMIAFGMILSVSRQNDEQSHDRPKSETLYEK